jgi:DNA polymerase-3 subunit chi
VHEVLLNLGPDPVPGFESFERVLEIVGRDEAAVSAGRRRWRHYAERGYAVEHHQAG